MSSPPPPASWRTARGPRRRWPAVLVLISAAVLTGVVAGTAVFLVRADDPSRTRATGPAGPTVSAPGSTASSATPGSPSVDSSTRSPTAAPGQVTPVPIPATPAPTTTSTTAPSAPAGPDRSLRANALYRVDLGTTAIACDLEARRPRPPLADRKLAAYLRRVVRCLTTAFGKPLAAQGFALDTPKIDTYHTKVKTPCGTFGQQGSPAYYCSATETIYWPDTVDDGNEAYTFARLGYVGLVAHEFGHHLQATTGMLGEYALAYSAASTKARYALSRRLELQAQCFEGVFLRVARKPLALVDADRTELRAWHSYTGDEDPPKDRHPDHGTSALQYRWLERGLDSGDFGRCNTWTASKDDVK